MKIVSDTLGDFEMMTLSLYAFRREMHSSFIYNMYKNDYVKQIVAPSDRLMKIRIGISVQRVYHAQGFGLVRREIVNLCI